MTGWRSTSSRLNSMFDKAEKKLRCLNLLDKADQRVLALRTESGEVVRPFRGMYARYSYWENLTNREQIQHVVRTLAYAHPSWIFTHATAAFMYSLEVPLRLCYPIHYVTDSHSVNKPREQLVQHHLKVVNSSEVNSVCTSSIEQTVVDCAAEYSLQNSLPIVDSALHVSLTSKDRLRSYLNNRTCRRGVRQASFVIKYADGRPDSGGESAVRALMHELNLPEPELQAQIPNLEKPGHFYYADFLFTRADGTQVAMELDGQAKYGRDSLQTMMAERQREAAITALGIQVVRFSFAQAMNAQFLLRRLANYGIVPLNKKRVRMQSEKLPIRAR